MKRGWSEAPLFVRAAREQVERAPLGVVIERHNRDAAVAVERFKNGRGGGAISKARKPGSENYRHRSFSNLVEKYPGASIGFARRASGCDILRT